MKNKHSNDITTFIPHFSKRLLIYLLITCSIFQSKEARGLDDKLPSPENFLIHFATIRENNLKSLIAFIKMQCDSKLKIKKTDGDSKYFFQNKDRLCSFTSKLTKFFHLQAKVFLNKDELIYFPDIENETSNPNDSWNLSQILSQNYILRSNPNGVETTIDQIVELLVQKKEILKELDFINEELKKFSIKKNLISYYLIPSLKATINNISPLGALLELFYNIKCELTDKFCLNLQGQIGAVLYDISQDKHDQITGFVNRFHKFTSSEKTQKSERLKLLLEFNSYYRESKITTTEEFSLSIKNYIMNFVADGEGGFLNDRYQNFAQNIIILSEVSFFAKNIINLSPYAEDLSELKRKKVIIELEPKINESLNILETQFKLLGFDEEFGE